MRVFSFIVALLVCGGAFAQGATGTEYVCFWSGDLRIFAHEDDTEVTLINIRSGNLLPVDHPRIDRTNVSRNPFVLTIAGDSFEGIGGLGGPGDELEVRIEATKPVTVWTGSLAKKSRHPDDPPDDTTADAWGSYMPAFGAAAPENGREIGREFMGFTSKELRIIARKDPADPTSITVEDLVTNTDPDGDDTCTFTGTDAVYADAEIEIFELDGFEDDTVHITSNVDITVQAGLALWGRNDWTVTPPNFVEGADGSELGTLFYAFVYESLTVFPTQDLTEVTITDLSDGDDSRTITLQGGDTAGDYDLYTSSIVSGSSGDIIPRDVDPAVTIHHNQGDPFDADYVRIESDKPILVYIGPVGSEFSDFSDVAYSIPAGPDSQIVYCYAQNFGDSNDLQVFGFDPDTVVTITSLSYTDKFRDNGQHDFVIGPGVGGSDGWLEGVGDPGTDVWWGAGVWNGEMLRIESTRPITVLNGDYDKPHFGAFVPFVLANPAPPPPSPGDACPHTQGYWKNHEEAWPVTELMLGAEIYDQAELLALLWTEVEGDASLILAHQLIAAKLNIQAGSDPAPVDAAITSADALLGAFPGKLGHEVPPSSSTGQEMVWEAAILDEYNRQLLTPDCDDTWSPGTPIGPDEPEDEMGMGKKRRGSGGGCAGIRSGPMTPPEIFGILLPYAAVALYLVGRRARRRKAPAEVIE